jgi:hypothetical protein
MVTLTEAITAYSNAREALQGAIFKAREANQGFEAHVEAHPATPWVGHGEEILANAHHLSERADLRRHELHRAAVVLAEATLDTDSRLSRTHAPLETWRSTSPMRCGLDSADVPSLNVAPFERFDPNPWAKVTCLDCLRHAANALIPEDGR